MWKQLHFLNLVEPHKVKKIPAKCTWTVKEDYEEIRWDTSCGNACIFMGGTPEENYYVFCPYCGKRIEEFIPYPSRWEIMDDDDLK
jgi:hypothetical protein